MSTVLLCPGQGTQHVGMGRDLAETFPAARRVFEEVDEALGFNLSALMWEGPEDELTRTHNAQPAILTHTMAVYAVIGDSISPRFGAGHSLGEYSAYAAAGTLGVAEAAQLVRRRGELMLEAGEARPGTMAAVIGLEAERVRELCEQCSNGERVVVPANINTNDQTVISGDPPAVVEAGERCKDAGARKVLPLKVSGAFHSPLMEPARRGLTRELTSVALADPAFPVIANATATPVEDAITAAELLASQLTSPVEWVSSMKLAAEHAGGEMNFVEVGPGKVLSGLVRRAVRGCQTVAIGSARDVEQFVAGVA
ncbi:MAG: ACP S-malonyltransferase [Gemmatimonadales bacterium]